MADKRGCDWMTDEQLVFWIERMSVYLGEAMEEAGGDG